MEVVKAKQRPAKMRDELRKSDRGERKSALEVLGFQFQFLRSLELHEFLQPFLGYYDKTKYPSYKLLFYA